MFDFIETRQFFRKEFNDFDVAVKVGELRPAPRPMPSHFTYSGRARRQEAECWHVIFSPDETRFAWLYGTSKVLLIPWNRYKNCLLSVDNTDNEGNEIKSETVCIDAGSPVNSAGFGSGTPECELNNPPHRGYWTRFDFSRDIIFATGHVNGRVRIWDVSTGRLLLELMDHKGAVRDLAFAPDGSLRLVTASLDGTLKMWDLRDDGNMFKTLKGHTGEVFWCSWSPNGHMLASAGMGKSVFIWDMKEYRLFKVLTGHLHNVVCCVFSPDGAILATASFDTRVILWDPYTGEALRSLHHLYPPPRPIYASGANASWVRGVAYTKQGCQVATISDDGFIRFWNLLDSDVDPISVASGDEEMVCCTFSPSGSAFAVGTRDSRVSFYAAPKTTLSLKHLCRMTLRRILATPEVDQLQIPPCLKQYLKYRIWE